MQYVDSQLLSVCLIDFPASHFLLIEFPIFCIMESATLAVFTEEIFLSIFAEVGKFLSNRSVNISAKVLCHDISVHTVL